MDKNGELTFGVNTTEKGNFINGITIDADGNHIPLAPGNLAPAVLHTGHNRTET